MYLFFTFPQIEELFERHESILTAGELASINGIRENIAASIIWSDQNANVVESWLKTNYGETSAATAISSSIVVVSFVVTVLLCQLSFN